MPNYSVSVKGLPELRQIPGFMDKAERELLENASKKIADEVGDAAPKRSGKLAHSWKAETLTSTSARVYSDSDYAKAQDKGAYIKPKRKALRFRDGHFQRIPARIPATGYVKKGLKNRGKIVRNEYLQAFGNLKD